MLDLKLCVSVTFGDRLLKSATEWTKCVFGASAEAVEAENLFFSLGGLTPPMFT